MNFQSNSSQMLHRLQYASWLTALVFLFFDCFGQRTFAQELRSKKFALLVACENYHDQFESVGLKPLKSPINDAAFLEKELIHLGYEVTRVCGTSQERFSKEKLVSNISEFFEKLRRDDDVFVYLSGHGVQLYGDDYRGLYFVPETGSVSDIVNHTDPGETQVYDNSLLSVGWLVDKLESRLKRCSIILDCCRLKPSQNVLVPNDTATIPLKVKELESVQVIYATSSNQAAFEDNRSLGVLEFPDLVDSKIHSRFTSELIKYLRGAYDQRDYDFESDQRKLDLNQFLISRGLEDSKQKPKTENPIDLPLGIVPPYTWDIQKYTTGLEPRINFQLTNTSVPLEFLLVNPTGTPDKKIQLVDKSKYERKSFKVDCELQMPFYLSVTEASLENWIDCLEDPIGSKYLDSIQAPSNLQTALLNRFKKQAQDLTMPAHCTWPEAIVLCQLMTKKLDPNLDGFYKICSMEMSKSVSNPCLTGIELEFKPNAYGFRLPTEAQWHWAIFQDKDPIGVIKAAGGQLRALQNGVKIPIATVSAKDPHEQLTSGFRYALGNMAEWVADDWYRTDSRSFINQMHPASTCGKQRRLGDKLLKGAGVLDSITDQRRQSRPSALDADHGLRLLYQPEPVQLSR